MIEYCEAQNGQLQADVQLICRPTSVQIGQSYLVVGDQLLLLLACNLLEPLLLLFVCLLY